MDSKTGTHALCVQVAQRPVAVTREVARSPTDEAEPWLFSARAALFRCHGNLAHRGEFFAPLALLFRVTDEEAAIASADESDFGWGGLVFTKDIARVNNPDLARACLPFGAAKTSGHCLKP